MKNYEKPEIEIVKFRTEDILVESGTGSFSNPDIDGGTADFPETWSLS